MLLGLTEKVSLELGFERRKSLSMADDKEKTAPGDRANVRKGALSYQGETKCMPSKILSHYLKHIPPLKILSNLEKIKLNESGRQKLGM